MNTNKVINITFKLDFNLMCRTCLASNSSQLPVVSIFQLNYQGTPFVDIFNKLFKINVSWEDKLPKNLCENCITEIIRFHEFQKNYEKSVQVFRAFTGDNTTCHDSEKQVSENVVETVETPPETTENLEKSTESLAEIKVNKYCSELEELIKTEMSKLNAMKEKRKALIKEKEKKLSKEAKPVKTFLCSCGKVFTLYSEFVEHRKEEKHSWARTHPCTICNKHFTFIGLKQHMKRHAPDNLSKKPIHSCPVCGKICKAKFRLTNHMRIHTKEKPYECKLCSMRFSLSGNLKRHMMRHTGEKPHVCEFCGKGFIQGPSLTVHKRIHTGDRPYLCAYCGKTFRDGLAHKVHLRKHEPRHEHNGRPTNKLIESQCKICLKVFTTKTVLKTHLSRHGDKNFLCSDCGKRFYTNAALKSHYKVHSGEKPYSCQYCHKNFSQLGSLKTHILTHTGGRPFVCQICSKSFTQKPHLKLHLRTHNGERPYTCSYCNKSFSHSGTLTVHVRTHTGETPYMCDMCPRGFYDSTSLKRHKVKHSDTFLSINSPLGV